MSDRHTTVNVSSITILKVLAVILLLWFLWAVRGVVLLFLISIIIASAIDPLAEYLYKKRVPRGISVLLVYVLFIGIVGMVIALMIPPIVSQFETISQSDFYDTFNQRIGGFRDTLDRLGVGDTVTNNVREWAGGISQGLFNTASGIVNGFVSVITVLAVSFYLSAEENGTKNFVKHLVPYKKQAYVMRLVDKIQRKMGAWVLGQVVLCVVVFGLTYIGLVLLGVEFALVLALIAGLLEIIPFIGPILSAIPAIFFAFLQNPPLAIAVVVLYLIVQQIENHILVPVVMSRSVGLNPILVILGILVGGTLGGVVGAIIAVPIISGIQIFIRDVLDEDFASEVAEES